jgi:protein TonB
MAEAGFLQQRRSSPTGFAMVVLLHAAVFAALILVKGSEIVRRTFTETHIINIPVPPDPDPVPPPDTRPQVQHPPTTITQVPPIVPSHEEGPVVDNSYHPPVIPFDPGPPAHQIVLASIPPPPPVRREPELLGNDLQPPYPLDMQRAEREGDVRVRVTIGANGRVTGVERLSASSESFWSVTQRQALNRWRFRPATEDGRPVESSKVMIVHFRLDG